MPTRRLASIDFLRGLAAVAVLVCHAFEFESRTDWLRDLGAVAVRGALGVPLFFVVSGFCIHLTWARRRAADRPQDLNFLQFWRRRLRRLYPPYMVTLCLSMGLLVAASAAGYETGLLRRYEAPRSWSMAIDFLLHATMLHGLSPSFDKMGGNPPFWTLAREEYFYLLYFPLLFFRQRWPAVRVAIGVLVLGLLFPVLFAPFLSADSPWWGPIRSSAIVLWFQWCLGVIAVEGYLGLIALPAWARSFSVVPVFVIAAELSTHFAAPLTSILWGLAFFVLLNACVAKELRGQWWEGRLARGLGNVGIFSYSLYLVHYPLIASLRRLVVPSQKELSAPASLLVAVLLSLVALASARIFFHLVERRFFNSPSVPAKAPN